MALTRYTVQEIDGIEDADLIRRFNAMAPDRFPALQERHLVRGYWWLVADQNNAPAAFAGLVAMVPFDGVGYMKRAYVRPEHRGHGLQLRLMQARERKARELGWSMLVGECDADNHASAHNFIKAGFVVCEPEQPWARLGSVYFVKRI